MATAKHEYTNEGGSARGIIQEFYRELSSSYKKIYITDEDFEMNFIEDSATLPRILAGLTRNAPPYDRGYIDNIIGELCEMENSLVLLQRKVSRWNQKYPILR